MPGEGGRDNRVRLHSQDGAGARPGLLQADEVITLSGGGGGGYCRGRRRSLLLREGEINVWGLWREGRAKGGIYGKHGEEWK